MGENTEKKNNIRWWCDTWKNCPRYTDTVRNLPEKQNINPQYILRTKYHKIFVCVYVRVYNCWRCGIHELDGVRLTEILPPAHQRYVGVLRCEEVL